MVTRVLGMFRFGKAKTEVDTAVDLKKAKKQYGYYEYYAYLHHKINVLYLLVAGCIAAIILLLGINIFIAKKPPYVVRIDAEGKLTGFQDLSDNLRVTDIEVIAFARDFMEKFVAFNSHIVREKFADALNMMTPKYQEMAVEDVKEKNLVKKIEDMKIRTIFKFNNAEIVERSQNKFFVRLSGTSEVYSLLRQEGTPVQSKKFTAEVLLVAVPRTEKTPRGLLADSFIHSYDLASKKGGEGDAK